MNESMPFIAPADRFATLSVLFEVRKVQMVLRPFQLGPLRAYSKPGLTMDREWDADVAMYPTYPMPNMRDYSEPGFIIEDD